MTKEQEEAIERLKQDVKYSDLADTVDDDCTICFIEDVETVLNLIQEQQKENEKKDKIIELMAEKFEDLKLAYLKKENGGEFMGKYRTYNKNDWKQYFENQAKM